MFKIILFFAYTSCIFSYAQNVEILPKSYKIEKIFDCENRNIIKNEVTIDFKLENIKQNLLVQIDSIKCIDVNNRKLENIFYQKSPFNEDDNFGYFTVKDVYENSKEIKLSGIIKLINKNDLSNKQMIPYNTNFLNKQVIKNPNEFLKLFIIDLNELQYYKTKDKIKFQSKMKEIAENFIFGYTESKLDIETITYFFEKELENQYDIYLAVKDDNNIIAEINVIDKNGNKINTGFYSDTGITKEFKNLKLKMQRSILNTDKIEIVFFSTNTLKTIKFEINNIKL